QLRTLCGVGEFARAEIKTVADVVVLNRQSEVGGWVIDPGLNKRDPCSVELYRDETVGGGVNGPEDGCPAVAAALSAANSPIAWGSGADARGRPCRICFGPGPQKSIDLIGVVGSIRYVECQACGLNSAACGDGAD